MQKKTRTWILTAYDVAQTTFQRLEYETSWRDIQWPILRYVGNQHKLRKQNAIVSPHKVSEQSVPWKVRTKDQLCFILPFHNHSPLGIVLLGRIWITENQFVFQSMKSLKTYKLSFSRKTGSSIADLPGERSGYYPSIIHLVSNCGVQLDSGWEKGIRDKYVWWISTMQEKSARVNLV